MPLDGWRKDAAFKPSNVRVLNATTDHDLVALVHLKARMGEAIGERSIIRHEKQS